MTTIPQFILGSLLTIVLFLFYVLILTIKKVLGKEIKIIFKTIWFILKYVRIVPCFTKGVYTGKMYKNSIADKNKQYVILLKIRVNYTLKYVVYNCQTQKLYMI